MLCSLHFGLLFCIALEAQDMLQLPSLDCSQPTEVAPYHLSYNATTPGGDLAQSDLQLCFF